MRKVCVLIAGFTFVATQAFAAPAAPPRKPGLWSQTIATGSARPMTMKLCIDAATNAKISAFGSQAPASRQSTSPIPGGWRFQSVCDMGPGGKMTSSGTATGDFNSAYTVKATTVTTGAAHPGGNGTHNMTMTAKWEGACPAGMKGGDMTMPGGMKVNILQR